MKKLFLICLLAYGTSAFGQRLYINGPNETCPNTEETYHVFAKGLFGEKLSGGIGWLVYIDGVYKPNLSQSFYSCGNTKDFYITIPQNGWGEVGQVELKVTFKGGAFCGTETRSKFITSRVPDPGLPTTASGGLNFCPGETKTVYLSPGYPINSSPVEICYFHHGWTWTVPIGWTVSDSGTGTENQVTSGGAVKVTAPSNVMPGAENLFIRLEADGSPFNEWIPMIEQQLTVGIPQNITVSGSSLLCTTNQTYTAQNLPSGANVSWSVSPTSLFAVDTGTGSSFVTRASSSTSGGQGSIIANINGCGQATKQVQVGPFNTSQITVSGTVAVCPGNSYVYTANVSGGHKSGYVYQWTKPSNWVVNYQSGNTISFYVPTNNPDYGTVRTRVNNGCGYSSYTGVTVYPGYSCGGGSYYSIYPNPTSTDLTIEMLEEEDDEMNSDEKSKREEKDVEFAVELTDDKGKKVHSNKSKNKSVKINTTPFPKGVYILNVISEKETITERILIE